MAHQGSRLDVQRFGAWISFEDAPVGAFLDGACPQAPGEYAYMPVRSPGHSNLGRAVRSGRPAACTWSHGFGRARFDVLAIPRYGVLAIADVVLQGPPTYPGAELGEEPPPPWVQFAGADYRTFSDWCGDRYVALVWRPFWDATVEGERKSYLERFAPPAGWSRFLEDVALDEEVARIDAEDIATGVLQPNGALWPQTQPKRQA